ncbi:bifunctional protein-disulfide isomerase/oxidoreductase DsbC [Pseudidiomarina insulisalsae]|uniref:Thiol:disulfide interchange protein n=1 Tax=Pseudidiomarina insulisalsae TaxID=575789 RepID=A0A432YC34_9GAMM|nr:bifunctional protein-disulfide isomerase/oxidoreductase DsbC [Pseudidiomarina insulisalsae]RUO58524.1 bifunctional protein-disulfide isomerase/oxidoreductase DsbC [Pseudidiomarina insulisalsae]
MKQFVMAASLLTLLACTGQGEAQSSQNTQKAEAQEAANSADFNRSYLQQMGFAIESVEPSSVAGVYEVITDQGLIYVADNGKKLIGGRIYDITGSEPVNLSEQAIRSMRQRDIAAVAEQAITYRAEDEKYVVTVFTDPTCGYCRQLHNNLDNYLQKGITIRYLAWPRSGLQGSAYQQLKAVWCAADPQAAMTAAKSDQRLQAASCDDPVDEHFALGNKFGVRGTPAMVLPSGELIPGLVDASRLLTMLKQG